jgi:uncharacterized protein
LPKPKKERTVLHPPSVVFFKPQGIPMVQLEKVILNVDEYEAIRLVDYDGLDQEEASKKLGVSRPTCARIMEGAHKKIAEAITQGKAIQIEGGQFVLLNNRMRCRDCGHLWETIADNDRTDGEKDNEKATSCPKCLSERAFDLGKAVGSGGRGGRGMQGGGRRGRQG